MNAECWWSQSVMKTPTVGTRTARLKPKLYVRLTRWATLACPQQPLATHTRLTHLEQVASLRTAA